MAKRTYKKPFILTKPDAAIPSLAKLHTKDVEFVYHKMNALSWSIKDGMNLKKFPFWLLEYVYSVTDTIYFQGRATRGRVIYVYIPSRYTIDFIPIIVDVQLMFGDLPKGVVTLSFNELKRIFKNNKFKN